MSNPIVVMFENIIDGLEKKLDAAEAEIARIKAGYIAAKESVQKIVVGLEAENKRLRAGLAELAAQAREDLADLHECDACEGMRSDQDDLRNPAGDDRPCPQCGGIGRYDERAPLARAVLRLADESETTRQPEAAP